MEAHILNGLKSARSAVCRGASGLGLGWGTRATWSFLRVICPISRFPTKDLVTRYTRSPDRTRMMKFGGKNPTFSPIFP